MLLSFFTDNYDVFAIKSKKRLQNVFKFLESVLYLPPDYEFVNVRGRCRNAAAVSCVIKGINKLFINLNFISMKKNYFYSLFAALMLFMAMPAAAQMTMADLFGRWRFTAEVEWGATATDEQKAQLSGDCEVIIAADDVTGWYEAKIVGFAGSVNPQFADIFQSPSSGAYAAKITNPNPSQDALWNGMLLANANGDNPYGIWEDGTEVVKGIGIFYYILNDEKTELKVQNDFTVVSLASNDDRNPATFRNAKMTLVEAETVAVDDISGEYVFKAGTSEWSTMEGAAIPTEFGINIVKKSDDNKTYDATIAIEGYDNVTLPGTYDGSILSLAFDNSYIKSDYSVLENSIRFADYNTLAKSGTIEFSGVKGSMSNVSGIALASDSIGKNKAGDADSTYSVRRQWYMDGTLKFPSAASEFSWAGVFDVTSDVILAGNGASGIEWPEGFQMEIQYIEASDAYFVTKLFGFDLSGLNNGGFPLTVTEEGAEIVLNGGVYGVALLKSNGDGTYLALTNQNGVNTDPIKLALNEDGTVSMESCFVQNYDFTSSSFTGPVVFYQNLTATAHVEGEFELVGDYVLTAGTLNKYYQGSDVEFPKTFDVTISYFDGSVHSMASYYYVSSFMGKNIGSTPINITIVKDGEEYELATGGMCGAIVAGETYYKIYDMNASTSPLKMTVNADGTANLSNFFLKVFNYSDMSESAGAFYQNVTLVKKAPALAAPVLASPDTSRDITSVYGISLQFEEEVAVNASFDGDILVKKDGEKVDFAYECNVPSWDATMVNFSLYNGVNTPGTYTFEVPAGLITSADGSKAYEGGTFTFTVVAPAPSASISPDGNQELNAIDKITISFKNVESVEVDENATVALTFGIDEYEGIVAMTTDKDSVPAIEITFDDVYDEVGEYQLIIPAGFYTMKGLNGSTVSLESETVITYTVVEPADVTPLAIESVMPTGVEGEHINSIIVSFNQDVQLAYDENWQTISSEIYLTDADGDSIKLTETGNWFLGYNQLEYAYVGDEPEFDENWIYLPIPITAAGTYTLDVSQIVVGYGMQDGYATATGYCEGTYSWTLSGAGTSIDGVEAEAENAEIYDLTGRRVEKITNAGIYIINGKKVLVK